MRSVNLNKARLRILSRIGGTITLEASVEVCDNIVLVYRYCKATNTGTIESFVESCRFDAFVWAVLNLTATVCVTIRDSS